MGRAKVASDRFTKLNNIPSKEKQTRLEVPAWSVVFGTLQITNLARAGFDHVLDSR